MMYNYLVVGSGLYGAIFAHEAKKSGKTVLVVDNDRILLEMFTQRKQKVLTYINMEHIFSILTTRSMELYHSVCRVQQVYKQPGR